MNNNFLDNALFRLTTKLTSDLSTIDIYATRADWNLTDDKLSTILQKFKFKVVSKDDDKVFESMRIVSAVANGTIYGLPRYTLTLAVATDGANPTMRGLANSDDGSNIEANRIPARIVSSFPADSPCGIFVGSAEFNELLTAFNANVAIRYASFSCFDKTTDVSIGDGRGFFPIPSKYNGDRLTVAKGFITGTAGTTGNTTIQVYNVTQGYNMLSTPITIASGASIGAGVIDDTKSQVLTDDLLRVDIDGVSTNAPTGLSVNIEFEN